MIQGAVFGDGVVGEYVDSVDAKPGKGMEVGSSTFIGCVSDDKIVGENDIPGPTRFCMREKG